MWLDIVVVGLSLVLVVALAGLVFVVADEVLGG